MQTTRTLGILILLLLGGAALLWTFTRSEVAPVTLAPAAAPPAGQEAVDPATGGLPDGAGRSAEKTTRVAVATAPGTGSAAIGPALVGQVVDEGGRAVADAAVTCWRGFGAGFDPESPEFLQQMENFDPSTFADRARSADEDRAETRTDAQGRFRLVVGGAGRTVFLRVRARGQRVLDRSAPRPVERDVDLGVLTLKLGAVVSGRVVDRAGNGVAGARVAREGGSPGGPGGRGFGDLAADWDFELPGVDALRNLGGQDGITDAEGRFELPHCEPGEFALRARHADHPPARREGLSVAPGGALSDVVVLLEPGATISGRLVDVPEGTRSLRVLAAARPTEVVRPQQPEMAGFFGGDPGEMMAEFADFGGLGERSVEVGPEQTFALRGLKVGKTYRIWIAQTGRGFVANAVCSQRIEVGAPTEGIELRYDPGIAVTLQVVDAATGAPVEPLWVKDQLRGGGGMEDMMAMAPRGSQKRSYPEGRVTLANLRPKKNQTLSLTIDALGYRTFERSKIELPLAGQLDLGIVRLEPAPVLAVVVRTKDAGSPVAGAAVRVAEPESPGGRRGGGALERFAGRLQQQAGPRSARSDAEGRCTLNVPSGATVVVTVTSKEHAPYRSAPLSLTEGKSIEHVAQLLRGGTIEVTALDAAGEPLAEARIERAGEDGVRDSRTTNRDGVAAFEHLVPGSHRFRIGERGGGRDFAAMAAQFSGAESAPTEPGWQIAQVEDGGRATITLTKDPTASLRGVVRENGQPVAGARVQFVEGPGKGAEDVAEGIAGMVAEFGGNDRGRGARTGDDGSYLLKNLAPGQHRVRVSVNGRAMPAVLGVSLQGGENVFDVDLEVTIVRGTVRDGQGQPIGGASVTVVEVRAPRSTADDPAAQTIDQLVPGGMEMLGAARGGRSIKTADDGTYELRGVRSGVRLQVRASARNWAAVTSQPFELAPGGQKEGVDLQLLGAGRVRVTLAESVPFASARARLLDASGEPEEGVAPAMQLLNKGKGTLDGLRAGRWRVEVILPAGGSPPLRIVEVVAGETAEVAF